jgi:hypothetical protein
MTSILSILGAIGFVILMAVGLALFNIAMDAKEWLFAPKPQTIFKDEL